MKYRKKPVVIEAFQLPEQGNRNENNMDDFHRWSEDNGFNYDSDRDEGLVVHTLEGDHRANPSDWIIKGVKGEFYPCKPDIFEQTYEKVED